MDCGPTCLRMIARYNGKSYSPQFLRSRSYITKSGVSMPGVSDDKTRVYVADPASE